MIDHPQTVPICDACWVKEHGDSIPVRLKEPELEVCFVCGEQTRSGIYVRKLLDQQRYDVRERLSELIRRDARGDSYGYVRDIWRRSLAEIVRLEINCRGWYDQNTSLIQQRDKILAENNELRAEIERLRADRAEVHEWMREPDYVENASIEWLAEWMNRRPLAAALKDTKP